MAESITINIAGREVGIQYHPDSMEATIQDEMVAREMGLQVLAAQAIELRKSKGIAVPAVLEEIVRAHTFHDLLRS